MHISLKSCCLLFSSRECFDYAFPRITYREAIDLILADEMETKDTLNPESNSIGSVFQPEPKRKTDEEFYEDATNYLKAFDNIVVYKMNPNGKPSQASGYVRKFKYFR